MSLSLLGSRDVGLDGTTRYGATRSSSNKGDFQKVSRQNKCVCMCARTHACLGMKKAKEVKSSLSKHCSPQASRKCKSRRKEDHPF
jgi:hypothetical protein